MTEIITLAVAKQRLDAVVEQYGAEHKPAERCAYFKKDVNGAQVPLCIIGAAFADELRAGGISTDRGNGEGVYRLSQVGVIHATELATMFLNTAQDRQDSGRTWGEAVREAADRIAGLAIATDDTVAVAQA